MTLACFRISKNLKQGDMYTFFSVAHNCSQIQIAYISLSTGLTCEVEALQVNVSKNTERNYLNHMMRIKN